MPEVKMDFIPEDMTDDESEIEVKQETDETEESVDVAKESIQLPKAKSKRDDMNVNDIFNMPESIPQNIKLTKKGVPRKKRPPMTEEHKIKLARAREMAMEARKKKAQEKKENKALELEEKELLKKQKVKRVKELKEEVLEEVPIKKEPSFSKKDLEDAQLQAIMNYEKIRKQRKEEKREKQKQEAEQEALKAQLRRAVAPPQPEYNNPFSMCY